MLLLLLNSVESSLEGLGLAQVPIGSLLPLLDLAVALVSLGLESHLPALGVLLLGPLQKDEYGIDV